MHQRSSLMGDVGGDCKYVWGNVELHQGNADRWFLTLFSPSYVPFFLLQRRCKERSEGEGDGCLRSEIRSNGSDDRAFSLYGHRRRRRRKILVACSFPLDRRR
ncbi:unnamed protein product [Linum trigynum]|uniref:Uncharacterized protein n=1 Tax=Linum trigynum TaxID=586398 RepID=A0AAV2ERD0_9ROSI